MGSRTSCSARLTNLSEKLPVGPRAGCSSARVSGHSSEPTLPVPAMRPEILVAAEHGGRGGLRACRRRHLAESRRSGPAPTPTEAPSCRARTPPGGAGRLRGNGDRGATRAGHRSRCSPQQQSGPERNAAVHANGWHQRRREAPAVACCCWAAPTALRRTLLRGRLTLRNPRVRFHARSADLGSKESVRSDSKNQCLVRGYW